jgi:hypothetical protein
MQETVKKGIVNLLHANVIIWQGDTSLPHSQGLRCGGKLGDLPQGIKPLTHLLAVCGGRHPMPLRAQVLGNRTIREQETPGVPWGS